MIQDSSRSWPLATVIFALLMGADATMPCLAWPVEASIGLKGGFSFVNFVNNDIDGIGWSIGGEGGAVLALDLSQRFGIQTEVLYVRKGASSIWAAFKDDADLMFIYQDYLEVPLLAKYVYKRERDGKASGRAAVLFGPSFGFNVGSTVSAFNPLGEEVVVDLQEVTERIDYGLVFGWGLEVDWNGPHVLTFDARYTLGLARVFTPEVDTKARNSVISLMVGYSFRFIREPPP